MMPSQRITGWVKYLGFPSLTLTTKSRMMRWNIFKHVKSNCLLLNSPILRWPGWLRTFMDNIMEKKIQLETKSFYWKQTGYNSSDASSVWGDPGPKVGALFCHWACDGWACRYRNIAAVSLFPPQVLLENMQSKLRQQINALYITLIPAVILNMTKYKKIQALRLYCEQGCLVTDWGQSAIVSLLPHH